MSRTAYEAPALIRLGGYRAVTRGMEFLIGPEGTGTYYN
jgi:hypothetical protein